MTVKTGLMVVTTLLTLLALARVRGQTTMAPPLMARRVDESELPVLTKMRSHGGTVLDTELLSGEIANWRKTNEDSH